jgi:hypothetical protein
MAIKLRRSAVDPNLPTQLEDPDFEPINDPRDFTFDVRPHLEYRWGQADRPPAMPRFEVGKIRMRERNIIRASLNQLFAVPADPRDDKQAAEERLHRSNVYRGAYELSQTYGADRRNAV